MKNSTIPCLLALLFFTISVVSSQNSPRGNARANRRPSIFSHRLVQEALLNHPDNLPPGMKDDLRRWLNPTHAAEEKFTRHPQNALHKRNFKKSIDSPHLEERHDLSGGVREAWVRHYVSGLASSLDEVTAMTVDGAGNVYVTGYGANLPFKPDYVTMKYDPSGTLVWSVRYNGLGEGMDWPFAIEVDASGNVYVTGSSTGAGTEQDYVTIKYSSAGLEQWVARYNGSGNAEDWALDLAVDRTGNVYVTGRSAGAGTAADYLTIKYNGAGAPQWVARYNGSGNADDWAINLDVDLLENVYVTGTSQGVGTAEDYLTIKYNSSGAEQWVARYNGPSENNYDEASALVIDRSGNVFVTGTSVDSSTIEDYTTIKYNSAGVEQWVARYNGPGDYDIATAIAIDNAGNIYVTGNSDSAAFNSDYATVKYSPDGTQQWVVRYNGPADDSEEAVAVAVDGSGYVYVTGRSFGDGTEWDYATVKYAAAGIQQWVVRYNGPANTEDNPAALAIDAAGNVYVAGASDDSLSFSDYATIKYNSSGIQQWLARQDNVGNAEDQATALAVDAKGNVYVTGKSKRAGSSLDYLTIKYGISGSEQWMARYNGPGNDRDEPVAIAVDDNDNVYVTGKSVGSGASFDYATIKYNSAGAEQWVARYNGTGNAEDFASGLAVDASGSVYVTGSSKSSGTSLDYLTIKYNAAGTEQWVARYNGPANAEDEATALAVDGSGNVYVTGSSQGSGTSFDYATIEYNPTGAEQWVARYNGSGNDDDEAVAIVPDGAGNVYVTGSSIGLGTFSDYVTIKYNSMGAEQWVNRYDDPARPFNLAIALGLDNLGNIYVTGTSWGPSTAFDYVTIKYNDSGSEEWVTPYDGPISDWDQATGIAVDDSGNVYVTGWSASAATFSDYATVKYNSSGAQQWLTRYNHLGASLDQTTALAVDDSGNVYVTGWSGGEHWSIYSTIKYAQTPPVAVQEKKVFSPSGYWLSQNYPNPLLTGAKSLAAGNLTTTIRYALPKSGYVTLRVFNLLGEEMVTLVNARKPAGEHEVRWSPPLDLVDGIYLYRLQVSGSEQDYVEIKKMILLR